MHVMLHSFPPRTPLSLERYISRKNGASGITKKSVIGCLGPDHWQPSRVFPSRVTESCFAFSRPEAFPFRLCCTDDIASSGIRSQRVNPGHRKTGEGFVEGEKKPVGLEPSQKQTQVTVFLRFNRSSPPLFCLLNFASPRFFPGFQSVFTKWW